MASIDSLPPLRFEPILKERAWGGRRLESLEKSLPEGETIGESWELADLPDTVVDGRSQVAEGPFRGQTLHELLTQHGKEILGDLPLARTGGFPLLVKFLDAQDNLSVQVHPDAAYAREHPGAFLKSETWFILQAEPGACVYRGLHPDVDRESFRKAIIDGTALECMIQLPANPGDCIRLPSGTCHALGAGVLAAEVQTPSDTTFRVWDWNRNDPNRPLHIDAALEAMHFAAAQADEIRARVHSADVEPVVHDGITSRRICTMDEFTIDLIEIDEHSATHPMTGDNTPVVLICVEGSGQLASPAGNARFQLGDVVVVPASNTSTHIETPGQMRYLRTDLPPTPETLLA